MSSLDRALPTPADIEATLDALEQSLALEKLRRYFGHRYWEAETEMAKAAIDAEGPLPLESVAAHSWYVADAVVLVGSQIFAPGEVDLGRAAAIAVAHDKLEMFIGDWDPVGDGTGKGTHAFDPARRAEKHMAEERAAEEYLSRLPRRAAEAQQWLFAQVAEGRSVEARLVGAVDKLVAVVWETARKAGDYEDEGIRFLFAWTGRAVSCCPEVEPFMTAALRRLCGSAGALRGVDGTQLYERLRVSSQGRLAA